MMEQRSELFAALVQGNEQDFPEDGVEYSTASEDRQQLLYSQGLKIVSNSVRTNEWNASVREGGISKQFTVHLTRHIDCSGETCQVFVKQGDSKEYTFKFNSYALLCYSHGQYAWEDSGHNFVIICNSQHQGMFRNNRVLGGGLMYHLFVDGYDVTAGKPLSVLWRRRARPFIITGLVFILVFIWFMLMHADKHTFGDPDIGTDIAGGVLCFIGVLLLSLGLVPYVTSAPSKMDRY